MHGYLRATYARQDCAGVNLLGTSDAVGCCGLQRSRCVGKVSGPGVRYSSFSNEQRTLLMMRATMELREGEGERERERECIHVVPTWLVCFAWVSMLATCSGGAPAPLAPLWTNRPDHCTRSFCLILQPRSEDPAKRARAIVKAVTHFNDPQARAAGPSRGDVRCIYSTQRGVYVCIKNYIMYFMSYLFLCAFSTPSLSRLWYSNGQTSEQSALSCFWHCPWALVPAGIRIGVHGVVHAVFKPCLQMGVSMICRDSDQANGRDPLNLGLDFIIF